MSERPEAPGMRQLATAPQDDVLMRYLDALLRESPGPSAEEAGREPPGEGPAPAPAPTQAQAQAQAKKDPVVAPATVPPATGQAAGQAPGDAGTPEIVPERTPQSPVGAETGAGPVVPEQPFKVLLFEVGGMTFAAPVRRLGGIIEWNGEATAVPGAPPGLIGLVPHHGHNIRVLDSAHLLLGQEAGRREEEVSGVGVEAPGSPRYGYVILIGDRRYGLACEQVRELIQLAPADVRWRRGATRRPWFAGIVTSRMCALLDPDAVSARLLPDAGDKG